MIGALGRAYQLGVVVRDLEAAMAHWTRALGVGPFLYMQDAGPLDCVYRGQPSQVRISLAFAYTGEMQVELIQQTNDAPSPYLDFLASGREGLQHLAFYADDFDAATRQLEAGGLELVYRISMAGERIHYYDDPTMPGTMTEIVPRTPLRRRLHASLHAAAEGWEGERPVRRYASLMQYMEVNGLL